MAWQGFEVFRRRQKVILATLAVLAMVLFIVGDVLIGVRLGHYGLGYGLRSLFYDTRLEQLLELHDRRVAAIRTLLIAHARGRERWLMSRFKVSDPKDIKDENLRKEHDKEIAQASRTWLGQLYQQVVFAGLAGETFGLDAEGLLQFAYWKEEADRLGIVVAPSIIQQEFERFTFGQVNELELRRIIQQDVRYLASSEELLQWWGDEIRAALARRIVSGTAPQRAHAPTLFDLWQAYRELGTSLPQVAWITLDVNEERFVRSVPEPTDQELQSFFEKYKQQEPDPLRAEPGFRVPTRYRVEFIYADVRYDAKDPARTGEAWPHYRQLAEAGWGLAPLLGLTPALSSAGPFLPALATHGLSLKVPAYERYLALRDSRFRLNEPRASYARTGTPWGQRIHHHGLLPPGSGPWYRPGAAEMEQATQAVLQTISALANLPAVSNPAVAMSRPITVRAPYAECLALDLAGSLAHHLGLTVALAAPVVAGPEPGSFWPTAQVTTVAAACLVGQLAGPGIPTWTDPLWRETYRPPQNVPILRLAPVGEGLALAWWMPTHYVPFTDVANELELDFLRSQVTRLLDGDLQRLQKDLSEYQKLYEKAYREWRKLQRKLGTERFTPPPFGPNKEPLQAYLERFCQARGLRYFPMPQPRNRFELMPRASGELGKILYPLYVEAFAPPPATHPLEAFREELEFADTLIQGRRLLMDLQSQQDKAEPTQEQYGLYQGRYLIPKGMPQHRALIWKAEESPGYVPRFEEVREQVRQAWTKQKARELAQKHAEELAERIRQLHQQRQSSLEDVLRELRGDPNFPELDKMQTVELRRFQYQFVSRPVTGLEKSLPGPAFRAVRYPPVVDYPERDFLQQALDHLRQSGDTWITTNQPGDKVHLLVLVNEPRFPTPTEFAMDYLRRPTDSRIRVEDASGSDESLEEWVSRRRQRQYREQFLQFLRQRYGLDDEKWRQLQDHTRRYLGS